MMRLGRAERKADEGGLAPGKGSALRAVNQRTAQGSLPFMGPKSTKSLPSGRMG